MGICNQHKDMLTTAQTAAPFELHMQHASLAARCNEVILLLNPCAPGDHSACIAACSTLRPTLPLCCVQGPTATIGLYVEAGSAWEAPHQTGQSCWT